MITLADIDAQRAKGLGWRAIARELHTTPGTVFGKVWRRDHPPPPPGPRKMRDPAIYTHSATIKMDEDMLHEIDVMAARRNTSRSAAMRDLIEWGLDAERGETR